VARLAATGATVVLFTGADGVEDPLFRRLRGRTAIYNEHVRLIAARHNAVLVDMWSMRALRDRRLWSADRIHLNAHGHTLIAATVLSALGTDHTVVPADLGPRAVLTPRERREQTLRWAREHAVPWIGRRLRGTSSGDGRGPKRPTPEEVSTTEVAEPG
jgi:hypothetical protein